MRTAAAAGALAALASLVLTPMGSRANPAVYVATPQVTEGEREVELVFGAQRLHDGTSTTGTALKLGAGLSAWWAVEASVLWHREPGERIGFDSWEIESRVALTEPGRHPVDLGLLVEVERPKDHAEGWELRYGPLLEAQWGDVQGNLNLLFERHFRAERSPAVEFGYQWQLRWRRSPALDWGLQGLGETGPWRRWNVSGEQSHQLGPAAFGKLRLPGGSALKYDAAFLIGTGGEAPRRALRARLEFEFF